MVPKQEPPGGKITEWTQPDQPIDPKNDHPFGCYGIAISPIDGTCGALDSASRIPKLVRIERGPNPPQSSKAEVYAPPADKMPLPGSRSVAIDSNGVAWQNWREPIK